MAGPKEVNIVHDISGMAVVPPEDSIAKKEALPPEIPPPEEKNYILPNEVIAENFVSVSAEHQPEIPPALLTDLPIPDDEEKFEVVSADESKYENEDSDETAEFVIQWANAQTAEITIPKTDEDHLDTTAPFIVQWADASDDQEDPADLMDTAPFQVFYAADFESSLSNPSHESPMMVSSSFKDVYIVRTLEDLRKLSASLHENAHSKKHITTLILNGITDELNPDEQHEAAQLICKIIEAHSSIKKIECEYNNFTAPDLLKVLRSFLHKSEKHTVRQQINLEHSIPADVIPTVSEELIKLKRFSKDRITHESVRLDEDTHKRIALTEVNFLLKACKTYMKYLANEIILPEFNRAKKIGSILSKGKLTSSDIVERMMNDQPSSSISVLRNDRRCMAAAVRYRLLEQLVKSTVGAMNSQEKIKAFENKYLEIRHKFPQGTPEKDRPYEREFYRSIGDTHASKHLADLGYLHKTDVKHRYSGSKKPKSTTEAVKHNGSPKLFKDKPIQVAKAKKKKKHSHHAPGARRK